MIKDMKPWKRGAIIGGIIGAGVIISLGLVDMSIAIVVVLFYPDFIIGGAIIGYLYGRYAQKKVAQ
ncbi:MAG: hypothetical protein ACXACY_28835 [Candidatus Hodarchaeales archaeon]|jgi:hypothetical protein